MSGMLGKVLLGMRFTCIDFAFADHGTGRCGMETS
jgi:hypothetical protein